MLTLLHDRRAVALLLTASLTILSNTLISPALPGIEAAFPDQPNAELLTRLLVSAPSLLVAICAPFAGALADRFGRRRQLLLGVTLFAFSGCAGLFLPTLPLILASRLLLGVAVAMIMTAQTALIGDYFVTAVRGRFMGLQIAATNFSGFIFLSLAGWLAGISPRLPFVIYAVALLYLPLMWIALTETDRHSARAHPSARTGEAGWPVTLTTVVALAGLSFVSFYLIPTQAPYYLARLGHPEPAAAAILLASVTLAGGVSSLAFGRLRPLLGRAGMPLLGYTIMAVGFGMLALAKGFLLAVLGAVFVGVATGFIMPTFLSIALDIVPPRRRGLASGAVTTSIFLGQFLSPLISQPLIKSMGYSGTFGLAAGLLAVLGFVALFLFSEKR